MLEICYLNFEPNVRLNLVGLEANIRANPVRTSLIHDGSNLSGLDRVSPIASPCLWCVSKPAILLVGSRNTIFFFI